MKRILISAAVAAAAILVVPAAAQGPLMGPGWMGHGMMGGYGMGSGMMWGYLPGGYAALDLSAEQRTRLGHVERDISLKQWQLMKKMHDQDFHMHDFLGAAVNEDTARKGYQAMADAHKEMFEALLEGRKRIDAVLTPEQREQLRRPR